MLFENFSLFLHGMNYDTTTYFSNYYVAILVKLIKYSRAAIIDGLINGDRTNVFTHKFTSNNLELEIVIKPKYNHGHVKWVSKSNNSGKIFFSTKQLKRAKIACRCCNKNKTNEIMYIVICALHNKLKTWNV